MESHEHTDQMDNIGILRARDPDEEIVGLDVTVYERLVMDRLNPGNLTCEQKTQDTKLTGAQGIGHQ